MKRELIAFLVFGLFLHWQSAAHGDSVNSPNFTLNADTNRATSTGPGAGNVSFALSAITVSETTLPEYSSGTGKLISIGVRQGYQFDPTSTITAVADQVGAPDVDNCGINGQGNGTVANVTPTGAANENIKSKTASTKAAVL